MINRKTIVALMRRSKCLQKRKKKLESAAKELKATAEPYAEEAETISDLTCIIKLNSLRKTAKTKQQEIVDTNMKIRKKQQGVER